MSTVVRRALFSEHPLCLAGGGGVEELSVTSTLTLDRHINAHVVVLTPDAARTVKVPDASLVYVGEQYLLKHGGTAYTLTITDTTGTSILALLPGDELELVSTGAAWVIVSHRVGQVRIATVFGGLATVDTDGAQTNGAGMMGDISTTEAAANYALTYSVTDVAFKVLSLSSTHTETFGANYQPWPNTAEAGDYVAFGHTVPFAEIAFDLSATVADYTGGEVAWEYWDGAAWAALTLAIDNTHASTKDGTKSFTRDGAVAFVPPSDWASSSLNSTTAYWVRCVVVTDMTTKPVFASKEHLFVRPVDGFICPVTGTITTIRIVDQTTGTLHTAADVKLVLVDITTGATSGELTFAQDKRQDSFAVSMAVTRGDSLALLVTQEDGTNEITNPLVELSVILD